jgi:uncharacterized protein YuzE
MKVRYFAETDTLLIQFSEEPVVESRDLNEDTLMDVDESGNLCSLTIEHASKRADAPHFSYEEVAA